MEIEKELIVTIDLNLLAKFSEIIAPHLTANEMIIKNSTILGDRSLYTVYIAISELVFDLVLYKLKQIQDPGMEIIYL